MQVTNNTEKHRFEMGEAFLDYRERPGSLRILHTDVPEAMAGGGIGGKLVKATLDYARERKLKVIPLCSFAVGWIKRHPEYSDLL